MGQPSVIRMVTVFSKVKIVAKMLPGVVVRCFIANEGHPFTLVKKCFDRRQVNFVRSVLIQFTVAAKQTPTQMSKKYNV